MTLADLEAYRPAIREPISGSYRGYTLKSMAPPSSGALTVLQILKMLERFPLGDASKGFGFGATNTLTVMADAMRLAFADRADWMADADFVPVPAKGLIASGYLSVRDNAITQGVRLTPDPLPGDPRPFEAAGTAPALAVTCAAPQTGPENGTTHFSVVDPWGNLVSYTNTIESGYGIGVFAGYTRSDGTFRNHGFLLNNELTDFNTAPELEPVTGEVGYNDVQPLQAPAQQHGADDVVLTAGPTDPRLRLARRGNDHQLGGQHHHQPGRPQDGPAASRRCRAHLGGRRRQHGAAGKPPAEQHSRRAARAGLHGRRR